MAAVILLTSDMQMQMAMLGLTTMAMLMGVQLQSKGCAHSQRAHDQQRQTDKEFSPGRHGLNRGQILNEECDQGQHNHSDGMPGSPGQTGANRTPGAIDGERRHRHEMIGTTDHMCGASGESRQQRDQHGGRAQKGILHDT